MSPSLTRSGLLVLGSAAAFVVAGALVAAWPLVALGVAQISAVLVLYVLFVPCCALLRRRQLELAWWVPAGETAGGALLADRPVQLHLLLRNHAPFSFTVQQLKIMASSALEVEATGLAATATAAARGAAPGAGHAAGRRLLFFHGLALRLTDRFGVLSLELYYPNLIGIKVFPPLTVAREPIPFRPRTGAFQERAGLRAVRQRGLGSDLREIRDHTAGDPFKRIAWKATARTRKLMVREFESEIMVTHWLLLDISSTMRSSRPGRSKLDYGLNLCAAYAPPGPRGRRPCRADHLRPPPLQPGQGRRRPAAPLQHHRPADGAAQHRRRGPDRSHRAGALPRRGRLPRAPGGAEPARPGRPPRRDDPLWERLVEGPHGEVYDGVGMSEVVATLLKRRRSTGASWWWNRVVAATPRAAQLRLFAG